MEKFCYKDKKVDSFIFKLEVESGKLIVYN